MSRQVTFPLWRRCNYAFKFKFETTLADGENSRRDRKFIPNGLKSFELLFWFSYYSTVNQIKFWASSETLTCHICNIILKYWKFLKWKMELSHVIIFGPARMKFTKLKSTNLHIIIIIVTGSLNSVMKRNWNAKMTSCGLNKNWTYPLHYRNVHCVLDPGLCDILIAML